MREAAKHAHDKREHGTRQVHVLRHVDEGDQPIPVPSGRCFRRSRARHVSLVK